MLYTIWDVYNHLKGRRDILRTILEANDKDKSLNPSQRADLSAEDMFLTDTLALIDRSKGLPEEEGL